MSMWLYWLRKTVFVLMGLVIMAVAPGCTEDNNAEFIKNAPPGPEDKFAGESFAERRARTRRLSKAELKLEAKRKAEAEKNAAAEKAK